MAIYGRFGGVVTVVREAVLSDVKELEGRKADKQDREALKLGSYVVTRDEFGNLKLHHLAFLRADGGSLEIGAAIEATKEAGDDEPDTSTAERDAVNAERDEAEGDA